jgi:hypothetical protein
MTAVRARQIADVPLKPVGTRSEPIGRDKAQDREVARLLARGDRDIATGRGHALDDVLADARLLLKR